MATVDDYAVNDPVSVISGEHVDAEAVVAYLGAVDFDSGDDWIGLRLTGNSVGQGKHNGTYEGKTYFICPDNCGIFVKANQVTKRVLTKLEELRLRRELAGKKTNVPSASSVATPAKALSVTTAPTTPFVSTSGSGAVVTTGTISTAGLASPPHQAIPPPPAQTAFAAAASPTATVTPRTSTRTKLDELRQRRAALSDRRGEGGLAESRDGENLFSPQQENSTNTASPSALTAATRLASSGADNLQLQPATSKEEYDSLIKELDKTRSLLKGKEKEAATLQQQLSASELKVHEAEQQVQNIKRELVLVSTATRSLDSDIDAIPPHLQEQLSQFRRDRDEFAEQAQLALQEVTECRAEWERDQKALQEIEKELQNVRTQLALRTQEVQILEDHTQNKSRNDASQYKERAKMQAETSALKRRIEQLEKEKQELENAIEDLTLDKEQLLEEKEALNDRLEEIKLDAETAQMEAEELKIELEDARSIGERVTTLAQQEQHAASVATSLAPITADAEDMQRALSVQNARLRDALIRLREQSLVEKMDLTRQLREAEKEAQISKATSEELDTLRSLKLSLEEQINDLKDMVEQGSAFESMVEDLSDRVMFLDETNVSLRAIIRELEEAADLTAEMEEVQNDEVKALTRDLEGRDSIIRNLEEAIKMQRRREEDFLRTVANYRSTVATLKEEKRSLLELQQGGEGEKSHLLAASQNALARAAQLVSNAADMRRREAMAVTDQIEKQMFRHMSVRFETLLPQNVVAPEISAIKGELLTAKLIHKASKTLEGIGASFIKVIRPLLSTTAERGVSRVVTTTVKVTDEARQKVSVMLYQAEFAQLIVELSSQFVRLIAAGQWPEVLSVELSIELGSILSHAVTDLDILLGNVLKSIKEEGTLTPEQTNIGALRQSYELTMQGLKSDIERDDGILLASDWNPPGWELMRDVAMAKFACQGAAAAISSVLHQTEDFAAPSALVKVYSNIEQAATQIVAVAARLINIDIQNNNVINQLSSLAQSLQDCCMKLPALVREILFSGGDFELCERHTAAILQILAKMSSTIRAAKVPMSEEDGAHALSPETQDVWTAIMRLAQSIRAVDGDEEDVNFLLRARAIEVRLADAVDNEPKLELANTKISQLEKSLASRLKEVSMQTARLTELEKLLARSSAGVINRQSLDLRSTEEYNSLVEENRVLEEAMDVLQRQVDEYENEIRTLKDLKSPGRARNRTPRRPPTPGSEPTPYIGSSSVSEDNTKTGALEATIFRPALQRALQDAARWKAASMAASLSKLTPLCSMGSSSSANDLSAEYLLELTSALCNQRVVKASTKLIDLSRQDKTPVAQIREMNEKNLAAKERIQKLVQQYQIRHL